MKTCTKCEREFPATLEYFYPRKALKSGIASECRDCKYDRDHQSYLAHQEERRARQHRYYGEHKDEAAAYYKDNADRIRGYSRAYAKAHPEWAAALARTRRARAAQSSGSHAADDVAQQYLRQHGCCYWCDVKVGKKYHVDHVTPLVKKGSNGPENLVIACPTCNLSKGAKLPHEFADRLC